MTATCAGVASILLRAPRSDPEHGGSRVVSVSRSISFRIPCFPRCTLLGDLRITDPSESEPCQEEEEEEKEEEEEEDLRPTSPMQIFASHL